MNKLAISILTAISIVWAVAITAELVRLSCQVIVLIHHITK